MIEKNQSSPTQGELRQAPSPTTLRVLSTTTGPGHAQRQVTVADEEGDLALSEMSELREETEDGLIKALRRMGIKAPKHFDPKSDKNFETWLERIEFHLSAIKCPEEDKTTSLLLLLDVNSFEASKHLGIKSDTEYSVAKQKLKDYFAITETKEELREKLDLHFQKAGETIEAYAQYIKLIGHKAYPNGDPDLLENILIKVFIHGLRDDKSRERVLLYSPKTLTEVAQYARFSEAAVRVANNRGAPTTVSTINSMNYHNNFYKRGRGRG